MKATETNAGDMTPRSSNAIREIANKNIGRLLADSNLEPLVKDILARTGREFTDNKTACVDAAEALLKSNLPKNIIILDQAATHLFKSSRGVRDNVVVGNVVWEKCKEILGWLLLLMVDEQWLSTFQDSPEEHLDVELKIPLQTPLGVEIIVARIDGMAAQITVNGDGSFVGTRSVCCENFLERGWGSRKRFPLSNNFFGMICFWVICRGRSALSLKP